MCFLFSLFASIMSHSSLTSYQCHIPTSIPYQIKSSRDFFSTAMICHWKLICPSVHVTKALHFTTRYLTSFSVAWQLYYQPYFRLKCAAVFKTMWRCLCATCQTLKYLSRQHWCQHQVVRQKIWPVSAFAAVPHHHPPKCCKGQSNKPTIYLMIIMKEKYYCRDKLTKF